MRPQPTGPRRSLEGFRRAAIAHYAIELFPAPATGLRNDAGLTPYGLVVRHYAWQLPHKFLDLEILALAMDARTVRLVVRVRCDPAHPPSPDPVALRDAVRWLKAMTTSARHRGAVAGRWPPAADGPWLRGFARRLLPSPSELARAVNACRQSSA